MKTYNETIDFLKGFDKEAIKKTNYTISQKKYDMLEDMISRIIVLHFLFELSNKEASKEEHDVSLEKLKIYLREEKEQSTYFNKRNRYVKNIHNDQNIQSYLKEATFRNMDVRCFESNINTTADKWLKNDFIKNIEFLLEWFEKNGENGYNLLYSKGVESSFTMFDEIDTKIAEMEKEEEKKLLESKAKLEAAKAELKRLEEKNKNLDDILERQNSILKKLESEDENLSLFSRICNFFKKKNKA